MLEHLLAVSIALAATASELSTSTDPIEDKAAEEIPEDLTVEIPPQDPPQLSLRMGSAYIDGRRYNLLAPSFTMSGLSIEVRYNKESAERRRDGTLDINDVDVQGAKTSITLNGQERSLEHQLGFNFGWDLPKPRLEKRYLRIVPSIHLNGGMELEITKLVTDGTEELPRNIDLRFFVGIGARARVVYPFSHLTNLPFLRGFELGVGAGAEYRRRDIQDIGSTRDGGNSYGVEGYMIMVYVPDKKNPTVLTVSRNGTP